jgi:hypothetical protein
VVLSRISNLPRVPLLQEFATNMFREFLIEKFKVRTVKQLYFLLDCLPISRMYKRITTFESYNLIQGVFEVDAFLVTRDTIHYS